MAANVTNGGLIRQAITTRYVGHTEEHGARVVAKAQAGHVIIPWEYSLGHDGNHHAAAVALCKRLGWDGELVGGALPDGTGNVYVFNELV